MRLDALLVLAASTAAGCGQGYGAAVLVTFSGDLAGPGGGYHLELRRPDGDLLPETAAGFADYQPGDQEVTLVLEDSATFGDSTSLLARVYAESWASDSGPALALGDRLVTLARGGWEEAALVLLSDPRPVAATLVARYRTTTDGELRAQLQGSVPQELAVDYALHLWTTGGAAPGWVTGFAEASLPVEARLEGAASPVERGDEGFLLTLEPGAETATLARSNGWAVASGRLDSEIQTALLPALAAGGAVPGMMDLIASTAVHVDFADTYFSGGDTAGAVGHLEHAFNIASGTGGEADINGDGTIDWGGMTDLTGIDGYRLAAVAAAGVAAETSVGDAVDRAAIFGQAQLCSNNLAQAVADLRAGILAFAADPTRPGLDVVIEASGRLSGDPFAAAAAAPTRQSGDCLHDRIEALTSFALAPLPAAQL